MNKYKSNLIKPPQQKPQIIIKLQNRHKDEPVPHINNARLPAYMHIARMASLYVSKKYPSDKLRGRKYQSYRLDNQETPATSLSLIEKVSRIDMETAFLSLSSSSQNALIFPESVRIIDYLNALEDLWQLLKRYA